MPKNDNAGQNPQRAKEAADPTPDEMGPRAPEEQKGDASSRIRESKEPGQDPEKQRVAEKLRERERDS